MVSDVVVVADVVVEEVADPIVVVEEDGLEEVARAVQLDADVTNSVSSVTANAEVTTPLCNNPIFSNYFLC